MLFTLSFYAVYTEFLCCLHRVFMLFKLSFILFKLSFYAVYTEFLCFLH